LGCGDGCVPSLRCDFAFAHLQVSTEDNDLLVLKFIGHGGCALLSVMAVFSAVMAFNFCRCIFGCVLLE
jgi:hypothetical protein